MPNRQILTFLLVPALAACGEDDPAKEAAFSRDLLLPLVEKPGKEKGLFTSYSKDGPAVWNPDFWGASLGFDQFTGIGWGTARAGVLVTPEHVVSSGHFGNNNSNGIHFHDSKGKFLGYRTVAFDSKQQIMMRNIGNDIRVVRLDSPAPKGARIYPLPAPGSFQTLSNWEKLPDEERPILLATDWRNPRPGQPDDPEGAPRWTTTRSAQPVLLRTASLPMMNWSFGKRGDPAVDPAYHEVINVGDSSNPVFWVTKSGLVLASTFLTPMSGPNYAHPDIQKKLQETIDELGGKTDYTLRFAPVP